MNEAIIITEAQRLSIVIDEIIFLRTSSGVTPRSTEQAIVIDDIVFLRLSEGDRIPLRPADIIKGNNEIRYTLNPDPFNRTSNPQKLILIDPSESYVELGADSLIVRNWIDDNGENRKQLSVYNFSELDFLMLAKDEASGKLLIHLYQM